MASVNEKSAVKSKDFQKAPIKYPLWFGGSSSAFAALVSHPLDLGKLGKIADRKFLLTELK